MAEAKPEKKGRYRKVEVRMWGDERFKNLSPIPACGQGLWLYLLTGPHTGSIPGLFKAGRAALAEELGWELEGFDKAFREAFEQGLVIADWKAKVVWIPNAFKYNKPENPNVILSWGDQWDLIPECDLKRQAYETLKANISNMSESFGKAFEKACTKVVPKTMANQEQEQEQEQDKKNMSDPAGSNVDSQPAKPDKNKILNAQAKEIFDHWKTVFGKTAQCKYTDDRKNKILARLRDGYDVEQCKRAIDGCAASEYHRTGNYTSIDLIFRNGGHLERFREMPLAADAGNQPAASLQDDYQQGEETYSAMTAQPGNYNPDMYKPAKPFVPEVSNLTPEEQAEAQRRIYEMAEQLKGGK